MEQTEKEILENVVNVCWHLRYKSDIEKLILEYAHHYHEMKEREKNDAIKKQVEIVSGRLQYHFRSVDGGWLIPKDAPFMKEFLNEVYRLCKLKSPNEKI